MFGKVFIIDCNGVRVPRDAPAVSYDTDNVLTLVDANIDCYLPCEYLLNNFKHQILVTSSPRSRRDRSWLKQFANANAVFTMESWLRKEFVVALFVCSA